ncbi:hypothetical protein HD806DRAFT_544955 [Xylariaceae sp. AK1471]|nr:hypothetical protein HD806DRAFT_544955 [Xylariaceae sp. AK1471]
MSGHDTPSVHRIGFTRLSRGDAPRSGSYQVNIIFVHGLRGHPRTTWERSRTEGSEESAATSSKRNVLKTLFRPKQSVSIRVDGNNENNENPSIEHKMFWPQDYLLEDVPEAEVWTYGYNADVIGGLFQADNQNSVSQHGRDLAVKLDREIENQMPIVFVAHSLGGIIVKDAICRSEFCRSRTKLIVFLGTPHRGSSYAGWGVIASNLASLAFQDSNKRIVKSLEVNSEVLDNIQDEFLRIAHDIRMKVHSFQEARAISGVKGLHGKVVDDYSSKVGLPPLFETVESIDANHMEIARCKNKTDLQYRAIVGVLKQFIRRGTLSGDEIRAQESVPAARIESERRTSLGKMGLQRTNYISRLCHCIPLSKNERFTGRDTKLSELKQRLFIRKECKKLAVVGLGGVGKTQVALELAYWVKDNQPDYSVFWVPALSDGSFEQAYTEMARRLDLRIDKNDEDLKTSIRRHLESEEAGKWLLIIDNADDMEILFGSPDKPSGIDEYLPASDNGLILFTTRSREVAVSVAGNDVVDLHEMSPEEATRFLEKTLIKKELLRDKATIEDLFRELTYLPLAIAQAAAYLNQNQMSISKYLALLLRTEQDMVSLMSRGFHDNTRYRGSQNAVATTWLVSFDQIRRSDKTAADLLSFVSCIEPKAIPQSILPKPLVEAELEHAIGVLCGYAFFVRRGDDDMFDMHRLVHVATRVWMQKHNVVEQTKTSAIQHLASIFPFGNEENRALWREYLPHAQHALRVSQEEYQDKERFELFYHVGSCLCADRRFKEAIVALEETCRWRKQYLPKEDHSRLASEHELARTYLADRRIKEAIEIFEHVVAVEKKTLAEGDHDRLASKHELARAYLDDGRIKEAIEILEHVVTVQKKTLAEGDHSRLASEHELASAYLDDGRIKEAIEIFEHVVALRQKTLTEGDHSRLASKHELARTYLADRRIKEAIEIFEHVVAVEKKTLAEGDHDRLASKHELARAYLDDGRIKEAIEILEHVVTVQKKTLAEGDHSRLASEHELASAYLDDGRIKEAIEIFEHVVALRQKTLTEGDHSRLASKHELARAYLDDGRIKEAIKILEHVVAVEKSLEISDADRIVSQELLTEAYGML